MRVFRKLLRKVEDTHFKIQKYMYKRIGLYRKYRYTLWAAGCLWVLCLLLLLAAGMGLIITKAIDDYTIWNALVTWYTLIGWGVLGLAFTAGFCLLITGCIYFFASHVPSLPKRIRTKIIGFQYRVECAAERMQEKEVLRQREAERMAVKGKPKWEV